MYSDKKPKAGALRFVIPALLLAALLIIAVLGLSPGRELKENGAAAIKSAVEKRARECYVVEGVYPPDLKYLEDNYGLSINHREYYVVYDIYASNVPPEIKVVAKD